MAASLTALFPKRAPASCLRSLSKQTSRRQAWRSFQSAAPKGKLPDFAFAFDIDGVLLRSSTPIPGATKALRYLQSERIPFILLTNGGGKSEEDRVNELQDKLDVPLDTSMFVQSHTPFADMTDLHDKTVLVTGGDYDKCRAVAQGYGFKNVVMPGDIVSSYPEIWPFSHVFESYYSGFSKPLPAPINPASPNKSLKIDAIFVYNDPRDWALDSQLIIDLLLSDSGILGTLAASNGDASLPNRGYQQSSQPHLYFSNPDLWWAAKYHLPRLGQGGFREAFEGLWAAVTNGAKLDKTVIGKPYHATYEFAERRLRAHRKVLLGQLGLNDPLRRVYMVGDNPESDIKGAMGYRSPFETQWESVLVRTGVYQGGEPEAKPTIVLDDVQRAVEWAVEDSRKKSEGLN